MEIEQYIRNVGQQARQASRAIARADTQTKNLALNQIATGIRRDSTAILEANHGDVDAARAAGLEPALLDRLTLSEKSIAQMADGVEQVAALPDPIGEISDLKFRPSGIQVGKMRVPLGVIGIIYEARPNVTADAAALCLKSGNAAILRGGSEAIRSNRVIAGLVRAGLAEAGLPPHTVQVIDTTDRAAVGHLITLREYVDVIVPRGGKGLISRLLAESRVPMIQHLDGNCHVYLDDTANADMAVRIVENAKTQRYGTCNTAESLLVARSRAAELLPAIATMLTGKGVEIRGCAETQALPGQRRTKTMPLNSWRRSFRSKWSLASTKPSNTSIAIARITPKRSSAKTIRPPCVSCARSIRPRSWSMLRHGSPMASSMALAPRSAFRRTRSTRAAPLVWKG